MLYPVAYIVEFEVPNEARKAGAKLLGWGIKRPQTISFTRDVKRGLGDLRAFPGGGQIEIELGSAIVVQRTVKAGALKFRHVVS